MWSLLRILFTTPSLAATEEIRVEVCSSTEDPWAAEWARRMANKLQRQWRRDSRRSDEPIPAPSDVPAAPPLPGVTLALVGDAGERTCITSSEGSCTFSELAPGIWGIVASKDGFRGMTIEGTLVVEGRATPLRIRLEAVSEDTIVTSTDPTGSGYTGGVEEDVSALSFSRASAWLRRRG